MLTGHPSRRAAEILLDVCTRTLRRYLRRCQLAGGDGLRDRLGGSRPRLTAAQEVAIVAAKRAGPYRAARKLRGLLWRPVSLEAPCGWAWSATASPLRPAPSQAGPTLCCSGSQQPVADRDHGEGPLPLDRDPLPDPRPGRPQLLYPGGRLLPAELPDQPLYGHVPGFHPVGLPPRRSSRIGRATTHPPVPLARPTATPGTTSSTVDVSVAVAIPGGSLLFLHGDGSLTADVRSIVANWAVTPFAGPIFTHGFGG